jgi:hypothetical protein
VYSAWLLATAPTVTIVPGFIPVSSNSSALNYGNNHESGVASGPFGIYAHVVSGVLMILLGIMILLYARLKDGTA